MRSLSHAFLTGAGVLLMLALTPAPGMAAPPALSDQDQADIQELVAHYGRALGGCAAEEWADLYAAPDGSFSSSSRGHVAGRDRLAALVRSEPACAGPKRSGAAPSRVPPRANVRIEATASGATGVVSLGRGAYYQDVYVKTPSGWRFASRNVLSAPEAAAHLTVEDFLAIRALAGDARQFDDIYVDAFSAPHSSATPGAGTGRLFRASGLVLTLTPEGAVHGKAYLRGDGGYYDDVYVKGPNGWRFQSRQYVDAARKP
ncbi:MAG TPA: nuclear transport factor 2 family protein [Vicinamibacterales bacterium]|nr:nuclear transport factor 2 family protein [Vicinamibacterales bacterium]